MAAIITREPDKLPAWLTIGETAEYLRRSTRTIRSWEAKKLIHGITRPAGGTPLVPRSEVLRLLGEGAP